MIVATCIGKEKKGNIINSIVLQDANGTIKKLPPAVVKRAMLMKELLVNNLKIDAAGRLIDKKAPHYYGVDTSHYFDLNNYSDTDNANTFNNPAGKAAKKAELLGYKVEYIFEGCQLWFKDNEIQLYIPDHVNKLSNGKVGLYNYLSEQYMLKFITHSYDTIYSKKIIVRGGSNLTDMTNAFKDIKVGELDLQNLNTSKVTTMEGMFSNASIEKITFGDKFNTSNVISMADMFHNTYTMQRLDISMFNTEKVTNMYQMFLGFKDGCTPGIINLSSFVANNKAYLEGMFDYYKDKIICKDTRIINEYNNRKF